MDMELRLARLDSRQTQVSVTCDEAFSHTFDLHTLIPSSTNSPPHPMSDPVAYGKLLYAALFPLGSLAQQALVAKPSRILLVAGDDALDALPWEYVYGPGGYVVCSCSFVRGLPPEQRGVSPRSLNGLHIVAVASSPLSHHLAPLNIQGEWTRLTEIVNDLECAVTLERAWPPTITRLRELVAGRQQRVVHFMGHGGQNKEAVLCFERDDGTSEDVSAREFVQRVQGGVFLVTLNACESATPGETVFGNLAKALVREQVPYALGMRYFVYDDDALAFSRDFYSNLARGVPVEDALVQARLTLAKSESAWAVGNLVLYTSLTHAAPGYVTDVGVPDVLDVQENALRGIIGVLPEVQGAFQGRIDEQIQLGKWLTGDRRPRIMTIHGNGGQGKTALARVAAERFAHGWPGGVWSIIMETVPTRTVFAASLARFLGIDPQQAELESQIQLRLRRRRTLLVLDNLETLDEAAKAQDAEALALIEFIQQLPGERTSLLCTSRHLLGWSGEQHLALPGLAANEGAALFQQSAPNRTEEIELSLAWRLSQRVDGHPLGLSLLGKAFNTSPIALTDFIADHEKYLLAAENTFIGVDHRQRKMYANVAYSVRWLSPALRDTLSKLWIFRAPFLPAVAVSILDPEHDANAAEVSPVEDHLYALWQRSLLTREAILVDNVSAYLYRLPPVMRPYVEQYLADQSEREELLRHFGEAYAEQAKYIYRMLVRGRVIVELALQCYEDLARGVTFVEGERKGYYLLHWGWIMYRLGDRHMAVAATEQVLEIAEKRDRRLEGQALHNLAMMSRATGHPYEALRLYEQALVISREVGDRAGEGTTLNNLGLLYNALGQKAKALEYYEQALVIRREVGDRAGEGTTLNNLGGVYNALGQKAKALEYYAQALVIRREVGDRAGEGTTLWNIGASYLEHQQYDVALACFLLAKEMYQQVQSPNADAVDRWITNLRERIGETEFASLLAQVEPQAHEIVEKALQEKKLPAAAEQTTSTMPTESITLIVNNTIAVMTAVPERRAEWRESIVQALQNARQRDSDWQIEVEFYTALLAVLDGKPPMVLGADHPYAPAIAAILDGIASGGLEAEEGDGAQEEVDALATFVQLSVAALRSADLQEKMAFMQQLVTLQAEAADNEMKPLFQAIQLALLGGDLAHVGDQLTGLARQVWDMIVAGVSQGDTPPDEELNPT